MATLGDVFFDYLLLGRCGEGCFFTKDDSLIDLLKPEASIEIHGGRVVLHGLNLNLDDPLPADLVEYFSQEKSHQSRSAVPRVNFEFHQAHRATARKSGRWFHVPHQSMSQQRSSSARAEIEPRQLEIAHRARFPLVSRGRVGSDLHDHVPSNLHLLPSDRWLEAAQVAIKNDGPVDLPVSV